MFKKISLFIGIFFLFSLLYLYIETQTKQRSLEVDTVYGKIQISDPVIIDLVQSQAVQRLKNIHQYGVMRYAVPTEQYSRYDHTMGVYALLDRISAPLPERVAGLLHDTSHTAFSHVADFVFHHYSITHSYQDNIHEWYLRNCGIASILERHAYTIESINHMAGNFLALENDIPDICADRIDYNLQGGLRRGMITHEEFTFILNALEFDGTYWYFTDQEAAEKISYISLNMMDNVWGSAWKLQLDNWAAESVRQALECNIISLSEFHFSTDDQIWERLLESTEPKIKKKIYNILNFEKILSSSSYQDCDYLVKDKCRGIDPLVLKQDKLTRLSQLNPKYAEDLRSSTNAMLSGRPIKLRKEDLPLN
jgi:hypothetical protein